MSPPLHKCPAPDCEKLIHKNQPFCRTHMKMVSEDRKGGINGTWRQYREARTDEQKVEAKRLHLFEIHSAILEIRSTLKKRKAA